MKRKIIVIACCFGILGLLAGAVALGGGIGAGNSNGEAQLVVTKDFGIESVGNRQTQDARESDTVMRLLQRTHTVDTRFGGGFVQSIDGVSGGREHGRPVDWLYYVNGIEAEVGAAEQRVQPGDRIWWDRHEWTGTMRIPAVVGSFPEPFRTGSEGRRIPTKLVCATRDSHVCDEVSTRLQAAGVGGLSRATLAQSPGQEVLRVVVGPWAALHSDNASRQIERGPKASGVFARFATDGRSLDLLDAAGKTVETLGAGAGLVAATAQTAQFPTWVITGTDDAGVQAAAAALTEERLRNRFALVVNHGNDVPVPTAPPGATP